MIFIKSIETFVVNLPLRKPFIISTGSITTRDLVIIKITDKDGVVGFGEAPTLNWPIYKADYPSTVVNVLKDVIGPSIFGKTFETPAQLDDALTFIRGHYFAKAAISIAAYDLYGKLTGRSVQSLLGGTRKQIEFSKTVSVYADTAKTLEEGREFVEDENVNLLKLKVKPGHDLAQIEILQKNFPQVKVMIDANASYSYSQETVDLFKRIDTMGLLCIEQPLAWNDLVFHAKLQAQLQTPLALDESIDEVSQVAQAHEIGSARSINLKIPRVGGLTESMRIHDYCQKNGLPMWIGGMIESPISALANIAFATKEGCVWPADFMETFSFIAASDELLPVRPFDVKGCVITPHLDKPGLGIEVDEKVLLRYGKAQEKIAA